MTDSDIPDGFSPARFSPGFLERAGPYWLKSGPELVIVGLRIDRQHINYVDVAHGGVLSTLADVAMSFQVHASETPRLNVVTNSLTCNFLAGARLGDWIEARARIDRIGKRTAYVSGDIRRGEERVLTMTGVFAILRSR
jgi:acyl-coenzyme A thioesterase 13